MHAAATAQRTAAMVLCQPGALVIFVTVRDESSCWLRSLVC